MDVHYVDQIRFEPADFVAGGGMMNPDLTYNSVVVREQTPEEGCMTPKTKDGTFDKTRQERDLSIYGRPKPRKENETGSLDDRMNTICEKDGGDSYERLTLLPKRITLEEIRNDENVKSKTVLSPKQEICNDVEHQVLLFSEGTEKNANDKGNGQSQKKNDQNMPLSWRKQRRAGEMQRPRSADFKSDFMFWKWSKSTKTPVNPDSDKNVSNPKHKMEIKLTKEQKERKKRHQEMDARYAAIYTRRPASGSFPSRPMGALFGQDLNLSGEVHKLYMMCRNGLVIKVNVFVIMQSSGYSKEREEGLQGAFTAGDLKSM